MKTIIKYLPVVMWALLILLFSIVPVSQTQTSGFFTIDKLGHLFFYFMFTFMLLHIEFNNYKSAGIPIIYGILIEVLQLFISYRTFSFVDIIFNTIGASLSIITINYIRKRMLRI